MKIGDLNEFIFVLVGHESKINIISKNVYKKDKWPIDANHDWINMQTTNEINNLYGACLVVKTMIGEVEVEQNFFIQNYGSYLIIFARPYINATRMETKILDDGSHYIVKFVALMINGLYYS